MLINMLKSKIHRATVTQADLNYVGSITIDKKLLEEARILPCEKVQIVNNHNGARFETYVIEGPEDSGIICLNGAAARLVQPGDSIIIISYCMVDEEEARNMKPQILFVNENNQIVDKVDIEEHGNN